MKKTISRRGFLRAGAAAAAAGMLAGAPAAAAAAPAAEQENCLEALFPAQKKPKYIFLFIGDGMGTAQIQMTRFYKGTMENGGAVVDADLSFTVFPQTGLVTTYDSTSFCPDSASTASSIASGHKVESDTLNVSPWTHDEIYRTIAEHLHNDKGWKVGIVTTVNVDHATPAAFYAHQNSRKNYVEISAELAHSGFEYFAGGDYQDESWKNTHGLIPSGQELARHQYYNVVTTQAEAEALKPGAGKTVVIAEKLADSKSLNYALDAQPGEWKLTDYVKKGIELLDNDKGFFMMAEAGKVDWACHANDAASCIHEVLELSNAVQAAVEFYQAHPDETLILVTADHETGGLSLGYATTNYSTYLTQLSKQTVSAAKFMLEYIPRFREQKLSFEQAMQEVRQCFGLVLPTDPDAASAGRLCLTDYEAGQLRDAYERTLTVGASSQAKMSQQDYEHYGPYDPFTMAVCHTLNHKSGVNHSTYCHSGAPVALYAMGAGAETFNGAYDNTEIYHKLAELTGVE